MNFCQIIENLLYLMLKVTLYDRSHLEGQYLGKREKREFCTTSSIIIIALWTPSLSSSVSQLFFVVVVVVVVVVFRLQNKDYH